MRISRDAISQNASNLDKKGDLIRETDKINLRKLIVTLTAVRKRSNAAG